MSGTLAALEKACGSNLSPSNIKPLLEPPCAKFLISKLLGYGIVVGSAGVKMPQVYNIMKAGSVEGLSGPSVIIEWAASVASFSYFMALGYPFSTWGENFFLFFQNGAIAALYLRFTAGLGSARFWLTAALSAVLGIVLYTRALPDIVLSPAVCESVRLRRCTITCTDVAGSLPVVLMLFGRLPQILQNARQGHTGTLSIITYSLNFLGGLARIFTVLQELDDPLVLTSASSAVLQNAILVAQILMLGGSSAAKGKKSTTTKKGA